MALRISDLGTAPTVEETDLVEIAEVDGESPSGYSSYKTTILGIANKIATSTVFSGLVTTAKNIVGAINEIVNGFDDNVIDVIKDLKQVRSATITDGIATFNDVLEANPLVEATATFSPKQDLHGYDYPWAGGAGKNKLQVTETSQTINGVTFTVNEDGTIKANGTANADSRINFGIYIAKAHSNQIMNGLPDSVTDNTIDMGYQGYGVINKNTRELVINRDADTDWDNYAYILIKSGTTVNNLVFKPMMRLSTETDPTFEPYSNICPISGRDGLNLNVSDGETEGTDYHATFDSTVYNGYYDFVSGEGTSNYGTVDLGDLDYIYVSENAYFYAIVSNIYVPSQSSDRNNGLVSSQYKLAAGTSANNMTNGEMLRASGRVYLKNTDYTDAETFKTAMSGVQLCYELATPTPIELTGQEVTALEGVNVVTTDGDGMSSVKYKKMNL